MVLLPAEGQVVVLLFGNEPLGISPPGSAEPSARQATRKPSLPCNPSIQRNFNHNPSNPLVQILRQCCIVLHNFTGLYRYILHNTALSYLRGQLVGWMLLHARNSVKLLHHVMHRLGVSYIPFPETVDDDGWVAGLSQKSDNM